MNLFTGEEVHIGNDTVSVTDESELRTACEKSEEEDEKKSREIQIDFLFDNFDFFWKNKQIIFDNEDIYRLGTGFSWISIAYIGGGSLSIGMLFDLWKKRLWTETCPECGGKVRIFCCGGSPLSGSHSYVGRCTSCGKKVSGGHVEDFSKIWRPARELMNKRIAEYANRLIPEPDKNEKKSEKLPKPSFADICKKWDNTDFKKQAYELRAKEAAKKAAEIEEEEKETKEMNDTMMLFGVDPSTGNIGYAYALIKKNGGC